MTCSCNNSEHEDWCDERTPLTPLRVVNRPGLDTIHRRVATHATAKATMLRALSRPELLAAADLTSRTDDDFVVALADTAAVAVDILSFYTDHLVGEHYLRTAQERMSVIEIARLLGYQPQPGLAAVADLAFTLDLSPGAPSRSVIPAGTAVQSSPEPGQQPVVYETLEDIEARPAWNAMRARTRLPHRTTVTRHLSFAGTVTGIAIGDGVLYRTDDPETAPLAFALVTGIAHVDAVPDLPGSPGLAARTEVALEPLTTLVATLPDEQAPRSAEDPTPPPSVSWLGAEAFTPQGITAEALDAKLLSRSLSIADVAAPLRWDDSLPAQAMLFRQQRALFGGQSPVSQSIAATVALDVAGQNSATDAVRVWAATLPANLRWNTSVASGYSTFPGGTARDIYLDGATPSVPSGSVVVVRDSDTWGAYRVDSALPVSVAAYGISGRGIRLRLNDSSGLEHFGVRQTTVFAAPEYQSLATEAAPDSISSRVIDLNSLQPGLRIGRRVVVTGSPIDDAARVVSFSTTLTAVVHKLGRDRVTQITLADFPVEKLATTTVRIAANVAPSSQGETRREVLGSGNARLPFQRFALRQPPLTYLSAPTPSGLRSTLTIRVDAVEWTRVESFQDSGPDDFVYVVRHDNDTTIVQFGDGITGARLPTGAANVTALYRTGSGTAGRVAAGQLSMPLSRAGGVTGVANPRASEGGDDREDISLARRSAPLRVTTLDRVVSLDDYTAFARAFPGIAKAAAVWARAGLKRGVLVCAAGSGGALITADSPIGHNLILALRDSGDPLIPVGLVPARLRSFRVGINVRTAPERVRDDVLVVATSRLRAAFSFGERDLAQAVASSEVVAVVQAVPGVVAATVRALWLYEPGVETPPSGPPNEVLTATTPAPGADITSADGAQLLVLDAAPITWGVLS